MDPGHYDFIGQRCVEDLKPARLTSGETGEVAGLSYTCGSTVGSTRTI
jgi:hypothetical protein